MSRSLAKRLPIRPPQGLAVFLDDLPLAGEEKAEDYCNLFGAILRGAKPADEIDWLYVKDIVDLEWDIRRERAIKTAIIKEAQKEVVLELLKTTREELDAVKSHIYRIFTAGTEAETWSTDSEVKKQINARLSERGYPPSAVLAKAYERAGAQIDAVERRIASYEMRKVVILREIERRNDRLARQLKASSEVLDAEFSEAAE
jgi:hypothetical protein